MGMWLLALALSVLTMAVSSACASPAPTPTRTPTPTLSVIKEWTLEGIRVEGSTVTVSLHVFASIDVGATLDGNRSDAVRPILPTIEYIFLNVSPGKHVLEVRDVVGFNETAEVVVPPPEVAAWLSELIQRLESEPMASPPASIIQYAYKGQTVYFLPPALLRHLQRPLRCRRHHHRPSGRWYHRPGRWPRPGLLRRAD